MRETPIYFAVLTFPYFGPDYYNPPRNSYVTLPTPTCANHDPENQKARLASKAPLFQPLKKKTGTVQRSCRLLRSRQRMERMTLCGGSELATDFLEIWAWPTGELSSSPWDRSRERSQKVRQFLRKCSRSCVPHIYSGKMGETHRIPRELVFHGIILRTFLRRCLQVPQKRSRSCVPHSREFFF